MHNDNFVREQIKAAIEKGELAQNMDDFMLNLQSESNSERNQNQESSSSSSSNNSSSRNQEESFKNYGKLYVIYFLFTYLFYKLTLGRKDIEIQYHQEDHPH